MSVRDGDEAAYRRYLLGLMPEAEAEALEETYFARPEVLERVRGVEDDLLDDYAASRLEPAERAAFERRYLASGPLRERVAAARALRLAATQRRTSRVAAPRWRIPLGLAAGLLLVILAVWLLPRPPLRSIASAPSAGPPATPPPRSASIAPGPSLPAAGSASSRLVVLALSPVLLRGQGGPRPLRVPDGTELIELELEGDRSLVPPSASALEAAIETVEGTEVWRGRAPRTRGEARPSVIATARVPAAALARGDYLLTLSVPGAAEGTVHRYFFRVTP